MMDNKYNELHERLLSALEYYKTRYETDSPDIQLKSDNGIVKLVRKCYKDMPEIEFDKINPLLLEIDTIVMKVGESQINRRII